MPIFSSRDILNFKATPKLNFAAKSHSPSGLKDICGRKKNGVRAKINGINFRNLNGWEAHDDNPEVNLMNPTFLY